MTSRSVVPDLVRGREPELLEEWLRELGSSGASRPELIDERQLRRECTEFLRLLGEALERDPTGRVEGVAWEPLRTFLADLSRSRGLQGFSPAQTATFVLSLKRPLFDRVLRGDPGGAATMGGDGWTVTQLIDRLALHTVEVHQRAREELILRQQQDMLELSTPVVNLWEGVLALPVIGALDSSRTQTLMENLLQRIVETGSRVAILDITGVPTVDTLVAQHLLKTVSAARLMGAECIISGIRPQIAQTIVHLGVDLGDVTTKATLAEAFRLALSRNGLAVMRSPVTGG